MREQGGERNGSRRSLARRQLAALSLASLLLLAVTATALAMTGDLFQPAGTAGCVSETGSGPCADGHGLDFPQSVAVAPGGKNVYVASYRSDAVVRFNRNTTSGFISQPPAAAGCVSETGAGPCTDGHALNGPVSVAVSADGKSVYVASSGSSAVARFNRNTTTGAITQPAGAAGCVSETGAGPCADGHGLYGDEPQSVAVAPDGKSVYAASSLRGTVVRFNRNTTTGAIAQPAGPAGCISETRVGPCADGHGLEGADFVAVAPGGKSVYVASPYSDAVARLNRNTTTGAITQPAGDAGCVSDATRGAEPCAEGHALLTPTSVAVSADGRSVYVASYQSKAVARFTRSTTTGAIAQPAEGAGCVSETGAGPCADGHALGGPASVAVSSDGKSVYVASVFASDFFIGAVARFNRNTTSGAISQPAGTAGCVSDTGSGPCADGHALVSPISVAVSLNGKSVYVASEFSDALARFTRAP